MTRTDHELLHRYCEARDREALDELLTRHYPAMFRTVRRLVHDEADAEDVVQAALLAAVRAGRSARPTGSVRAWLLMIAVNEARQLARRRRRRGPVDRLGEDLIVDAVPGGAEAAARREFERALDDALPSLPVRLKEPLVLHYYEELPIAAVGDILGLPKSTVQTRLSHGIARLRALFRRRGHAALLPLLELRLLPPGTVLALPSAWARPLTWILLMNGKHLLVAGLLLAALSVSAITWGGAAGDSPGTTTTLGQQHGSSTPVPSEAVGAAEEASNAPRRVLADAQAASVFGRVVDGERGAPIAAAAVTLYDFAGGIASSTVTDHRGAYDFPATRGHEGMFHLVIEKVSAGRRSIPEVRADPEPRRDVLIAGLVVRGRVVESDGVPVTRFVVRAVRLPFQTRAEWSVVRALHRQGPPEVLRTTRQCDVVDPQGAFCLRDLEPGRYALLVEATGCQPVFFNGGGASWDRHAGIEAAPEATAEPVQVELPPQGRIFVDVVDRETGQPIYGARCRTLLEVSRTTFAFADGRVDPAIPHRLVLQTGLQRDQRIHGITFVVTADGYAAARRSASGQPVGEVFVVPLGRPARVRGTVADDDGRPIRGATILVEHEASGSLLGSACTDGNGAFAISGLDAPSASALHCYSPDMDQLIATLPLRLQGGEDRRIDIGGPAARPGMTGLVTVRGEPKSQANLAVDGERTGVRAYTATDADGRYAFGSLPPDRYELRAVTLDGPGRQLAAERWVELGTSSTRVDFAFDRIVRGVVSGPVDALAAAAANGEVVARHVGSAGLHYAPFDERGRFELLLTETGTYELFLRAEGLAVVPPVGIEVGPDPVEDVMLRAIEDPGDGRIELRIVDAATGSPLSGTMQWTDGFAIGAGSFDDGLLVEAAAQFGTHRFVLSTAAHRPTTVEVEVTPWQRTVQRDVALELARDCRVTVVRPGSNAHRAGIEAGDLLRRYGDTPVTSTSTLRAAIQALPPNLGVVTLFLERNGVPLSVTAEPGRLGIEADNVR